MQDPPNQEPELLSSREYVGELKKHHDKIRVKALQLLDQLTVFNLRIGEACSVSCKRCGQTIAWTGHGKAPKWCSTCNRERRRQYCKTSNQSPKPLHPLTNVDTDRVATHTMLSEQIHPHNNREKVVNRIMNEEKLQEKLDLSNSFQRAL